MTTVADVRQDASRYAGEYLDDDTDPEILVADEDWGTLAHSRHELEVVRRYGDDLTDTVDDHVAAALDEVQAAMAERASELLAAEEVAQMPATVYRVQLGAQVYRTRSPHAAAEASREGARVTAHTTLRS